MYEQIQLVRNYLRMAWLYRWWGVALAILGCLGGWIYVYSLPDQYEVETKIYLDSSSMLRPLLQGLAFNSATLRNSSLMLRRTLLTRPNLEDVARRADLDLAAETPEEFDNIVSGLIENISMTATTKDNIYGLAYASHDPQTAKRVIDELLNVFLEASLGDTRRDTAASQRFIDEQIAEYEKRLIEAEERVKEFKQRNIAVMPGSQGGYFQRLQTAHQELKQAELDLREATRRRDDIKAMTSSNVGVYEEEESLFGSEFDDSSLMSPEVASLNTRIEALETQIDSLLIQYTEKHPDVLGARRTITVLKAQKEKKLAELAEQQALNPVIEADGGVDSYAQELKLQVLEAEAVVGALQTRVEEFQARVADLENKVDTVPEVEAELARLNRDYAINREQYDKLLERRELAYMSQEADASVEDVKIKVIEPPRIPLDPVGPPRLLMISIALLLALGAGGALSFILSQLNPRIIGDTDLRSVTQIPVIGAVGMVENPIHRRQRRMEFALFGLSISGLVAVYVGQILLLNFGVDLHKPFASLVGASL